jgi:uncharacterized protein (DUF2461 family)
VQQNSEEVQIRMNREPRDSHNPQAVLKDCNVEYSQNYAGDLSRQRLFRENVPCQKAAAPQQAQSSAKLAHAKSRLGEWLCFQFVCDREEAFVHDAISVPAWHQPFSVQASNAREKVGLNVWVER